jgi:glycerophosphoryl diester phosphodiesterase
MGRPQLIAHRGAKLERPENTLSAFLRALELGADAVELDVHATRDRVVVVHHDATVRPAGASAAAAREIASLSFYEARAIRGPGDGEIPSLAAVLDVLAGHADVYIEIKAPAIEAEVVRTIRGGPTPARCAVHSFDHRTVKQARCLAPELRGGILLSSYLVDTAAALSAAHATDCWMWWEYIDRDLLDVVHGAGGRVMAWTVNDPAAAARLTSLGVDGICSDDLPAVQRSLPETS